jgi:hypothetical protein
LANATANSSTPSSGPVEIDHLPPKWEPAPIRPRLPIGVAIVSILLGLAGIFLLLAGLLAILTSSFAVIIPPTLDILQSVNLIGALVVLILGTAFLVVATCLWRQETWALWTMIGLVFLTETYLFFTDSISILFLIFLVLFVYLLTVRRYFY